MRVKVSNIFIYRKVCIFVEKNVSFLISFVKKTIRTVSYTHLVIVDVFICVVCFNEVVCKGGFCSGVECLCVLNVSLFEATSCLASVSYTHLDVYKRQI